MISYPSLNFALGDNIDMLRDSVQQFVAKELAPRAAGIDSGNEFPMDMWRKFGDMGLLGLTVEEEYGGAGMGYLAHIVAMEEISRASASVGLSYGAHSNLCVNQIRRWGTPEQKARYLPKLCSGEHVGSLAMSEARYPITKAGLLELAMLIQEYHEKDLASSNFVRCEELADQEFDGRKCTCYFVEYKDAAGSPLYRKSMTLIDREWSIPVYIKNFAWPMPDQAALSGDALDEATLIEYYSYADIKFRQQLANGDFDRNNEDYRLH